MRQIPAAATAHLNQDTTTLASCWVIEKKDGTFIRGTDHDEDIEIESGDYAGLYPAGSNITASDVRSSADAAVDNMEVVGAFKQSDDDATVDVNVADIESGNLDGVPATMFVCNWASPDDWQIVVKHGYLGEISRTSDGRYTTELRGVKQLLSQSFLRTYSTKCQVKRFGDTECGFDASTVTYTGTVTAVSNRRRFNGTNSASPQPANGAFRLGELTFTSGANAGFLREIKLDDVDGTLGEFSFWENFPEDVQVGDTYTIVRGCDRTATACQAYNNFVNFRGYGIFIEGQDAITRGPL